MTRPYPDPANPGSLTNGQPMPGFAPAEPKVPEWHACEVCGRTQQLYEGYIEHVTSHPVGRLARRVNPQLFGDPKPLPSLAELGERLPVEGETT